MFLVYTNSIIIIDNTICLLHALSSHALSICLCKQKRTLELQFSMSIIWNWLLYFMHERKACIDKLQLLFQRQYSHLWIFLRFYLFNSKVILLHFILVSVFSKHSTMIISNFLYFIDLITHPGIRTHKWSQLYTIMLNVYVVDSKYYVSIQNQRNYYAELEIWYDWKW